VTIEEFVSALASRGLYHFSTKEAAHEIGASLVAAQAAIRRLRRKGAIATPFRGFNIIVPPEYRSLGCLPPEQFIPQLMKHLGLEYYVGLLSAAELHGAAHQRPQTFQVVVALNRPLLRCGEVRVQFIARRNVGKMPTVRRNTPRGIVEVGSPETTAFDLVGHAHQCGGFGNVATILAELAEKLRPKELARIAPLSPAPWAQRLGYLLEAAGSASVTEALAGHVAREAREYVPLGRGHVQGPGKRSPRWKLIVNEVVEPEL
jgi:predicted transcriptional regulator of viral defense system